MGERVGSGSSKSETREESIRLEGPYRIATVAELTGVPEPTLRAWERRYGIPTPERTASGYRLYGAEEVNQVREMRRLCDEGMAAAEAARLLLARKSTPVVSVEGRAADDPYNAIVESILDAVERFDDDVLEEQLRRVILLGSAGQIFVRVLAPVLITIGDRWHAGELSVAQEHYASQKLGAVLHDLIRLSPGTHASDCVVLGCFADEEHELGLLGFALRIAEWGTRPIFLGARTPPFAVRSAVVALSPKLVALSVSLTPPRTRARELLEEYAAACDTVPWIVGGAGAPPMADLIAKNGGLIAPDNPAELRALVEPLLSGRAPHQPKGRLR